MLGSHSCSFLPLPQQLAWWQPGNAARWPRRMEGKHLCARVQNREPGKEKSGKGEKAPRGAKPERWWEDGRAAGEENREPNKRGARGLDRPGLREWRSR